MEKRVGEAFAGFQKILKETGNSSLLSLIREGESLALYTTMKVGGPADYFVEPDGSPAAASLYQAAALAGLPCYVLGEGSNLIISDDGIAGLVIRLGGMRGEPTISKTVETHGELVRVRCMAGYTLKSLSEYCAEQGLTGMEFASGIPGSVGGAVLMNAGAYGPQMSDIVDKVVSVSVRDGILERSGTELEYGYRKIGRAHV